MSILDVYARISDDRTGQRAGVDRQVKDATALLERRGHEVGEIHVDNDISASRYTRKVRPGFQAMLARVESGEIEGFGAFHTDRLYRKPRELEDVIDLVEKRHLDVATCEGDFDLGTSDGRAMARVIVTMAAKESEDKSRRLVAMHKHLAVAGGVSGGGRRPFGYEADRMTIRLDEASLIREAADRVLRGESLRAIVHDWEESGIRTVTGVQWQTTTLKRMLCSGRIAGMREHKGQVVRDDNGDPVPTVWPAIITPEQSSRLRAILEDPERDDVSGREPLKYLLHGVIYCARCDVPMQAMPIKRKGITYRRYHCRKDRGGCERNGITAARVEEQVGELVDAVLADRKAKSEAKAAGEEQRLLDAIAAADVELHDWGREMANHTVTKPVYMAAAKAIDDRIQGLRNQLRRERMTLIVDDLSDEPWDDLDFDRRRKAVLFYIEKIVVQPTTKQNNRYDPSRWMPDGVVWRDRD